MTWAKHQTRLTVLEWPVDWQVLNFLPPLTIDNCSTLEFMIYGGISSWVISLTQNLDFNTIIDFPDTICDFHCFLGKIVMLDWNLDFKFNIDFRDFSSLQQSNNISYHHRHVLHTNCTTYANTKAILKRSSIESISITISRFFKLGRKRYRCQYICVQGLIH